MSAEFYLFDVDHGQSAALHLPNGRWCIFDVGCSAEFSPVKWITHLAVPRPLSLAQALYQTPFRFLKATVSHLHGDHLYDWEALFRYGPDFMRAPSYDAGYLDDCKETSSGESWPIILAFTKNYASTFTASGLPDYGSVRIQERSLSAVVARDLGGTANSRVNNASIVTRIDVSGNSILLCGDLEKEAWEAIIGDTGQIGQLWRPMLSNIDILVAPHHGHTSAYSVDLLNLAKPAVVLASVVAKDPNVDSRYSAAPVRGITLGGVACSSITTRKYGHIKVTIAPALSLISKGKRSWDFGDDVIQNRRPIP